MSNAEPQSPQHRAVVNPSRPELTVQSTVGVTSPPPAIQPVSPPAKVDTLVTGDAKVATHPQSMVGPAQFPQFKALGRYTIIGELGRGGMGVVYLAEDTILKRKVALKIPQFEPHKAEQMQARFIREAQMAAQLSHINICQIYDVGVIDGQYVMAMEYIDGKTLSDFTKLGKLISQRQAVYFVRKVAIAVEAAHQKGLIHRDLKPGNIMLPKADPVTKVIEPKVMDFGLAKSLESRTSELTKSGMIVGTPCYMSKEQWSGKEAQLGPPCDIYSLGIILYELLTGKLPYDVDDEEPATAWFVKLVTQPQLRPTERKSDIDPALDAIVMRAIAKEAADRYASMAEFAKDLDAWLKGKAKPAGQSLVGQLPPGLLPLADASVNPLLDLREIESIKSQPSHVAPTRRKPPGAIPIYAKWAAGGVAVLLLGITIWLNFVKKPDGTVKATGLITNETPQETRRDQQLAEKPGEEAGLRHGESKLPLDSVWTGTLTAKHPGTPETTEHIKATVTSAQKGSFTLRVEGRDGAFVWVYDCVGDGDLFTIRSATLDPCDWDETTGLKSLVSSQGRVTAQGIEIELYRPREDGNTMQRYVLQREVTANPAAETMEVHSENETTARLAQTLLDHTWHYHDSRYPPGDQCRFREDGTWHKWKWKYWVVGPREIRVHYDKTRDDPNHGIPFTFNEDLTQFTSQFDDPGGKTHVITGTRQ